MRRSSRWTGVVAAVAFVTLYAPIGVVALHSLNANRHGIAWRGPTLRWYGALLQDDAALAALRHSLGLAAASTATATVLGTMLALALARHRFPGRNLAAAGLQIPVFIPDIVMASSLLLFFGLLRAGLGRFDPGLGTMWLGHVTFELPFVAIVVRARLAGLDPAIEEAARDLGASPRRTFWHVTLPLIRPGVVAGALLAFTLSLDDFVVSFFTSGPGSTTLPILIYASVKRGLTPQIHALSTVMVLASVAATLALVALQRRMDPRAAPGPTPERKPDQAAEFVEPLACPRE